MLLVFQSIFSSDLIKNESFSWARCNKHKKIENIPRMAFCWLDFDYVKHFRQKMLCVYCSTSIYSMVLYSDSDMIAIFLNYIFFLTDKYEIVVFLRRSDRKAKKTHFHSKSCYIIYSENWFISSVIISRMTNNKKYGFFLSKLLYNGKKVNILKSMR